MMSKFPEEKELQSLRLGNAGAGAGAGLY